MPNDGTGTNWNIATPADTEQRRYGAQEIRDTKAAVSERMEKEHSDFSSVFGGGIHRAGSAQAFSQASAPTTIPDGTVLGAAHAGRIWFDSDDSTIWRWTGSAWAAVLASANLVEHDAAGTHKGGSA